MKMKKILNEWRRFTLNEANAGLYQLIGVPEGTIDNFINHFVWNIRHEIIKDWTKSELQAYDLSPEIDRAREEIPALQNYSDEDIELRLIEGWTFWWDIILGSAAAKNLVDYKVALWEKDMKINMAANKKMARHEFMFFLDYLNEFLENDVKKMAPRGDVEFTDRNSGLYGQLRDWWLGSTAGMYTTFKKSMSKSMARLDAWRKDPEERKKWK